MEKKLNLTDFELALNEATVIAKEEKVHNEGAFGGKVILSKDNKFIWSFDDNNWDTMKVAKEWFGDRITDDQAEIPMGYDLSETGYDTAKKAEDLVDLMTKDGIDPKDIKKFQSKSPVITNIKVDFKQVYSINITIK